MLHTEILFQSSKIISLSVQFSANPLYTAKIRAFNDLRVNVSESFSRNALSAIKKGSTICKIHPRFSPCFVPENKKLG